MFRRLMSGLIGLVLTLAGASVGLGALFPDLDVIDFGGLEPNKAGILSLVLVGVVLVTAGVWLVLSACAPRLQGKHAKSWENSH